MDNVWRLRLKPRHVFPVFIGAMPGVKHQQVIINKSTKGKPKCLTNVCFFLKNDADPTKQ